MDFFVFTQNDICDNKRLIDFILGTICENMSYIFGIDMGNEKDRDEWIKYNLLNENPFWRVTIGFYNEEPCGFVIYTINEPYLVINDFQIMRKHRMNPKLILGLFKKALLSEKEKFKIIRGYINKKNFESQRNFLKYSKIIEETKNGYRIEVVEDEVRRIVEKLEH